MDIGPIQPSTGAGSGTQSASAAVSPVSLPPEIAAEQRDLIKAVKAVNAADLFGTNSELTFVFDRESRKTLVRVIDRNTKEVLLQVPPERVLRMAGEKESL